MNDLTKSAFLCTAPDVYLDCPSPEYEQIRPIEAATRTKATLFNQGFELSHE